MRIPSFDTALRPKHAATIAAALAFVLAAVLVLAHPLPLYFVETQLGDVAARAGRWADAASFYERASELEPANAMVLERLGRCRIAQGEAVRAADAFERALVLEPGRADRRRLAMGAWQLAGNVSRMKELYDEGISLGATPRDLLGTDAPPDLPSRRRIQPARND